MKEIQVLNQDGEILSHTYQKRARQLVKSGRAQWLGKNSICLLDSKIGHEEREVKKMDYEHIENGPKGYHVQPADVEPTDEEMLYKMAKKRVKERHELIMHIVSYMAVNTAFAVICLLMWHDTWFLYIALFWGIGLACHIADYIFKSNPYAVEKEFARQKRIMERGMYSPKERKFKER